MKVVGVIIAILGLGASIYFPTANAQGWPPFSPPQPALSLSAWYTPDPIEIGKTMDIFVKVTDEDDNPIPRAAIKLTPMEGTFLWAASGVDPIHGQTSETGLFSTTFQTVLLVGPIGGDLPANSKTGIISIIASKGSYEDVKTELTIVAGN